MMLLMIGITYSLALKVYTGDKRIALTAAVLLASAVIFVDLAIEIRPDVPQTLFSLLAFYFIFDYLSSRSRKPLIISAVCLGFSFLLLQKAIFPMALISLMLAIGAFRKNILWRDIFIFVLVIIFSILPYYIYLLATGAFDRYFTFNWLLNMKFLNHFTAFNNLRYILLSNTLLTVLYITGLIKFTKTPNQIRFGWLSLGLFASNFLVRAPYKQYFMIAMPLMTIIAANALNCAFEKRQTLLPLALIVTVIVPAGLIVARITKTNAKQLEKIDYVLSITDPGDCIYDGRPDFNIFRRDIDFFWFSIRPDDGALATYQTITDYHYDIAELIDRHKPKVISAYYIEDMTDERIAARYRPSKEFEGLHIRIEGQ